MKNILIACALLGASSLALANDIVQFVCGAGNELTVSFPEDQDASFVNVNGIQYDYSNSYAIRRKHEGEKIMYRFTHNEYSVFLVINEADKKVSMIYEGRDEACERGTPYDL